MPNASAYEATVAAQRKPGLERCDGMLDKRELVRLATLAASSHNTQPWRFRIDDQTIMILPDYARRCPVVDPDDGHLLKSLGCAAENLAHAAAAQGHAAHVDFDSISAAVRIDVEPSKAIRPTALFHAITRRQCTKLPYDGQQVRIEERAALESAGAGVKVRTILIDEANMRNAIVDYVREGDVAQLSDRTFRKELMTWLRFNDASAVRSGDGLALRTMGQPSAPDWLGRIIMRFALTGTAQARTDAANIHSSPLIAVFVASEDTPGAWVEIGRVYERFALQATALNIRTAFINQPIEVQRLRPPHLNRACGPDRS